jgi:ribosomal protein L37AE/L43A
MGEICPSCQNAELKDLVPGIRTCPSCRKIFKDKETKVEPEQDTGGLLDGAVFMKETTLNPKWEICDKGITIFREKNKTWLAVLLCHSPSFPNTKYVRVSWWKKSINTHAGMIKIEELDEVDNFIIALERIEKDFDDYFEPKGEISYEPMPNREEFENVEIFNETKRECPKCSWKMKKSKNHRYFSCEHCGEIIILEDGHPVFNTPNRALTLAYSTNYPVNFYLPDYGITTKILMADWKAVVIIHKKENPDKKWLRLYWWRRDLQAYMTSQYSFGNSQGLKWEAKKGVQSPNIYDKNLVPKIIDALKQIKEIWIDLAPPVEEEDFILKKMQEKKEKEKKKKASKRAKKSSRKKISKKTKKTTKKTKKTTKKTKKTTKITKKTT